MSSEDARLACASDVGRQRSENQDTVQCVTLDTDPRARVIILADGMGGPAGGKQASETAVSATLDALRSAGDEVVATPVETIESAMMTAHETVISRVHEEAGLSDAGTTLVVAIVPIGGDRAVVGNVGDSRVYAYERTDDGGTIDQVTTDQSMAQEMVNEGELKPDEAADHPMSHVLAQAIGTADDLSVGTYQRPVPDRLLACSDGLTAELSDDKIATHLTTASAEDCCTALIKAANEADGSDNISVGIIVSGGG
jgi:protein phosphatase